MNTILKAATLAALLFSANSAFAQTNSRKVTTSTLGVSSDETEAQTLQQNSKENKNVEAEKHDISKKKSDKPLAGQGKIVR